jgi:hypothetical protein
MEDNMYKRFEIRRQTALPIEIISAFADEPFRLTARDLSPRGVYLECELLPDLGEHLICSFDLGNRFCIFGEVSRVNLLRRKRETSRPGFGVRFLDATPKERLAIRQALRGLPPPVPRPRRDGVRITRIITV